MALRSVSEARERIVAEAALTAVEQVNLFDAPGRTLAAELKALRTQPPFDVSAMDGYAVQAEDVRVLPAELSVIGESAAGRGFKGTLGAGQAVRIFTGAPVPDGANAIVIQENTEREGESVFVREGEPEAGHIRQRGIDFFEGRALVSANSILSARDVTLAAAMGHDHLPVRRRPRVALIATGDELVLPGEEVGPDQIVCSNPFGIAAIIRSAGGEPTFLGIARDNAAHLASLCRQADGYDVLVTIGGASVGDHDIVGPVLEDLGMTLDFWRIAMRPGKPLMFGKLGQSLVLGLPGNPVSSLICTRIFLVPLLRAMLGQGSAGTMLEPAVVATALSANGPREHYMRGISKRDSVGSITVTPIPSQDSSLLAPLAQSDVLIVRQPNEPSIKAGEPIKIMRMDF